MQSPRFYSAVSAVVGGPRHERAAAMAARDAAARIFFEHPPYRPEPPHRWFTTTSSRVSTIGNAGEEIIGLEMACIGTRLATPSYSGPLGSIWVTRSSPCKPEQSGAPRAWYNVPHLLLQSAFIVITEYRGPRELPLAGTSSGRPQSPSQCGQARLWGDRSD